MYNYIQYCIENRRFRTCCLFCVLRFVSRATTVPRNLPWLPQRSSTLMPTAAVGTCQCSKGQYTHIRLMMMCIVYINVINVIHTLFDDVHA